MKREPNPYAQQRTYTVTQTMAISVPSVVAEDVLDGEDGGMNAADSSALQELQSDMVELKSNVATLETNVTLIHEALPNIISNVTTAQQTANLALKKSQVTWLTTPDYKTSKLQITSGDGLKALSLTTNGDTSTMYDLVKAVVTSSPVSALTLSGFAGTYKDYDSTVLDYKLGLDFDFDTKQAYLIVKNGDAENWEPLQLGSNTSNNSVTCDDSIGRVLFSKGRGYDYIAIAANAPDNSSELAYYGLMTPFIYNATTNTYLRSSLEGNSPVAQVSSDGSAWTTVGGAAGGAANKLIGFIEANSNELSTDLDYQLCLGKDSSDLPYILVSNNEGVSWTPLQAQLSDSDRQRLDTIETAVSPPLFSGSSQNTYKLVGAYENFNRHLEFSSTIVDQLDTSAGAISLSNMVWLSANASSLAALLNS